MLRTGANKPKRTPRPTVEAEIAAADRALAAFARARELAERVRGRGDHGTADEIEALAWSLVRDAPPVRVSYARARLGVSDPTLRDWIARGILEDAGGSPARVTLESVALAGEEARGIGRVGRGLTDLLSRRVWWEREQRAPEFQERLRRIREARLPPPGGHRTAELVSIELHRLIARRLDEETVVVARRRARSWARGGGPTSPHWAREWLRLLDRPLPEIRRELVRDTQRMRDLRQATPFAGVLSEDERLRTVLKTAARS